MALYDEWKNAKTQYKVSGGRKKIPDEFSKACKAVDSAHAAVEKARQGRGTLTLDKANSNFAKAFAGLRKASMKVANVTGMSVSRKATPEEQLLKAAQAIVKAAEQALANRDD